MVAAVVGVAAVAGSIYSANKQSSAAKSAANAQSAAANQADATQLAIYNQQRADQEPFRQAGLTAEQQYMAMLGLPMTGFQSAASPAPAPSYGYQRGAFLEGKYPNVAGYETGRPINLSPLSKQTTAAPKPLSQADAFAAFRNTPGYQFGLDEGNKQVQASAAARGGLNSGATLKALMKFGNDYADQQGYTPYMNRLATLFGGAQQATNQVGAAGQNYANQVGNNLQNAGQARAQGIYGSANAWSNAANSIGSTFGNYMGYMQQQNDFGGV